MYAFQKKKKLDLLQGHKYKAPNEDQTHNSEAIGLQL